MTTRKTLLITLFTILALVAVACGAPATEAPEPEGGDTGGDTDGEMSMDTDFMAEAMTGAYSGTVVTMTGPFTDEDAVKFDNSVAAWEATTGIDIQYEGSKEFEASIAVLVEAGNAPDIVDFPQPGLLARFVGDGDVVDLSQYPAIMATISGNYNDSWLQMANIEGPDGPIVAGVWQRVNGKSLVWYPKAQWDAAGYPIPQTWDELIALNDQIVADGDTPWCIGIESGAATGWAATDWMEEIMLRTTSLENYDRWVAGELPFDSPEVKNAAETLAEIWFNEDYVYGGRASIVSTFFGDSPVPMFDDPPGCWMHKQGNFITSFFPEGTEAGVDYDFFYFPPIDEAYGKPVLVAGDIMAAFDPRPEVLATMQYFATGASLESWVKAGGAISPHYDSSLDWYTNQVDRGVAEIILNADSVRFDASDIMPGEVGAGTFWTGMTDWVSGSKDLDTVMQEIDASFP
jgi:alpha-glucoside transport system substrate-binding protein